MTRICVSLAQTFFLFILLVSVRCEVIVKETQIDPYTILFEKQSVLIDRIESIAGTLQTLQSARTEDFDGRNGFQADEKLAQIYSRISKMELKFDKMSEDVLTIKSYNMKRGEINAACSCSPPDEVLNQLFREPREERSSKVIETFTENETMNEGTDTNAIPAIPDFKLVKLEENHSTEHKNVDLIVQNIGLTLNNNMEYAFNKLKDIILQASRTANYKYNNFNNKSIDLISVNLKKLIVANQEVVENRIESAVTEELKILKNALFSEVSELRGEIGELKLLLVKSPKMNDSVPNETYDNLLFNDNEFILQPNAVNDTNSSASYLPLYNDELGNQTDALNETTTASLGSVMTLLNDMKNMLPTKDHDIIEESYISNQLTLSGTDSQMNQTKVHQNETAEKTTKGILTTLWDLPISEVLQKIENLQTVLSSRIKKTEEQIIGFKIYQSSALHSHMKEVRFELSKLRAEISRSMISTEHKINRKLESNKLSLFTFINAAVISITSSTVTSSKATGVAISKTLQNILQQLQTKVLEMFWFDDTRCPGLYQKVGSSCLLAVESMRASWRDTCTFCSSLGGVIPKISKKDLSILKQILRNETDGVWLKTENSSTDSDSCVEVDSLTPSTDNLKITERVCTAYMNNGTVADDIPCSKQLPVICQRPSTIPNALSNDFNLSAVLSDLDLFFAKSKYYKFKSYL